MKLLSMLSEEDNITKLAQEAMSEVEAPQDMVDVETDPYGYQVADNLLHNLIDELLPEIAEQELNEVLNG